MRKNSLREPNAGQFTPCIVMGTSAARRVQFQDPRPPHEIQFLLERDLLILLEPFAGDAQLTYRQSWRYQGIRYAAELRFEAALPDTNEYSLRLEAHFDEYPEASQADCRKQAEGWFSIWTGGFKPVAAATAAAPASERYLVLIGQALAAEAHLTEVAAVQQSILAALRAGAYFATSDKEGGTKIRFEGGEYVRAGYGESSGVERYTDERKFLAFLRQFYHWKVATGTHPEPLPDYVEWKLILRMLSPAEKPRAKGFFSRWFNPQL